MIRRTVTIGSISYLIAPELDLELLKSDALGAVRAGGGLIRVVMSAGRSLDVLVSASLSMEIEELEMPAEEPWSAEDHRREETQSRQLDAYDW